MADLLRRFGIQTVKQVIVLHDLGQQEVAVMQMAVDYDSFFNAVAGQWAIVKNVGGTAASMSSDPHPQNILRVNVNVQMFDTMYKGLGVSEGDGMYLAPDKRVNECFQRLRQLDERICELCRQPVFGSQLVCRSVVFLGSPGS